MTQAKLPESLSFGQVKQISLPAGWLKVPLTTDGLSSLEVYSPADSEKSQLAFYYRGTPLSQDVGEAFQAVLDENKGMLLARDLDNIRYILNERADPEKFQISSVETTSLNGRVLLVVQGRWLSKDTYSYELFIDAGQSGAIVQQIFFLAPKEQYHLHISEVKESLKSIQWVDR